MGGSRVQINKVHKTRFASKSSRQEHRIPIKDKSRGANPDKNASKGARAARIQRSKMLRDQKRAALLKEKRALSGSSSSPCVIVLFGLSSSVNLDMLSKDLLMLLSGDKSGPFPTTVASQIYKIRTTVMGRNRDAGPIAQWDLELTLQIDYMYRSATDFVICREEIIGQLLLNGVWLLKL